MEFPNLTSLRLYLREHVASDQTAYYDLLSNKQAIRYYGRTPFKNIKEAADEIELLHKKFESIEVIKWALLKKDDNQYIGSVGIKNFSTLHRRGTLSCIITPKSWGAGYATEALSTIINYCFEELRLNRLQAFVDPQNVQAMSLFDKLGFHLEAAISMNFYHMNIILLLYMYYNHS